MNNVYLIDVLWPNSNVNNLVRKLHWDPEDDQKRAVKWTELDKKSLNRLDDLFADKCSASLGMPPAAQNLGNT